MALWRRLACCFWAALLAMFVAKALGVPGWRHGLGLDVIGDQADFMLVTALLVWNLTAPTPEGR